MAMGDTMGKFNFKSRENRHELEFEGAPGYVPEYRPPRYWPPLYGPEEVRTFEGAPGFVREPKLELFLLAVSNMVGEDTFYEAASDRDARGQRRGR